MNKTDLITKVQLRAAEKGVELSKKAASMAVNELFDEMADALAAGEQIAIAHFGTLAAHERSSRTGVNPQTKEKMEIPARMSVSIHPAKRLITRLSDLLGKGF